MNQQTRSAFISLVGLPNVGKSTLLNALVGERVAIVSPKPQTTRTRVTGILTRGDEQIVFIDTPGVHNPRTKLSEYMAGQISESLVGADAAVLISEPLGEIRAGELRLLERLKARRTPVILAVNKIDALARKGLMMEKIARFSESFDFAEIIPLSAKTGDGVEVLSRRISEFATPGPHYFDGDVYTEQPERVIAGEMLREKLLLNLRDEIPHGAAVVIERMSEREGSDIVDVDATIYCEKQSHKGIIIGKNGEAIKRASTQARADMERLLQARVNLKCWVKVREDWRNREGIMRDLGFR